MAIPNNPAFTQAIIDWFTANPDPITPTNPEVPDPVYGLISNWDTSNITSMASAFDAANPAYSAAIQASILHFNQNLSAWDTHAVTDMSGMFGGATTFNNGADPGVGGVPFTAVDDIWNTGQVLNMSAMFGDCAAFNQDVSSWDTHSVTTMFDMFRGATTFNNGANPGVGGVPFTTVGNIWNTGAVLEMDRMFSDCAAFNQNVSSWDTHAVTNMQQMFAGATMFNNGADPGVGGVPFNRTLDSIWDTGQVLNMGSMFQDCVAFNQNVSSWDTHAVTTMTQMFYGATTFNNGAAPGVGGVPFTADGDIWNTGAVLNMDSMFQDCAAFNQNVSSWDTHAVTNMAVMFSGATTFNNGADPGVGGVPFNRTPNSIWDTGQVTSMFGMFGNCAVFNQNVSSWDTHAVTTMQFMFGAATTFNNGAEPGVSGVPFNRTPNSIWDTGQVTDMKYMFGACAAFNQNVSSWDTHAVTDMVAMFSGATTFNNGANPGVGGVPFNRTIGSIWDTGAVLDMATMFFGCAAFNQNVSSWDTHAVKDMAVMFSDATTFNNGAAPGVGGVPFTTVGNIWNTGAVLNMDSMFKGCAAFNQNVSSWDTHAVKDMAVMFSGATTFNNGADPGVGGVPFNRTPNSIWDTGQVRFMYEMFDGCAAFNQNVSSWDTHAVTTMNGMFYGATLFIGTGLDAWQLTLKPSILVMFINSAVPGSVNNNLIWNTWKTQYAYSIAELAAAGLIEPTPTPTPPIVSDICFPAGTPIKTDQGVIPIELLVPGKHTIRRQSIEHVTQTVTLDKYLIAFQPNAVDYKVPNKKTVMSKDHCIVFKGQLVPAYRFLDYSDQVKKVTYSGELLYNVLLATHGVMEVNNMQCETLHPANTIAKVYQNRYTTKLLPITKKHIMN